MLFQTTALSPHLSQRRNMRVGPKMTGPPKGRIDGKVVRASSIGLADRLDRRPAALSGGRRQRVAIGLGHKGFRFDAPLSNLDAAQPLEEIDATKIHVVHDHVETMMMADRIVVRRDGRIEQVGAPLDLSHNPARPFIAGFTGGPSMSVPCQAVSGGPVGVPALRTGVAPTEGRETTRGMRVEHLTSVGRGRRPRGAGRPRRCLSDGGDRRPDGGGGGARRRPATAGDGVGPSIEPERIVALRLRARGSVGRAVISPRRANPVDAAPRCAFTWASPSAARSGLRRGRRTLGGLLAIVRALGAVNATVLAAGRAVGIFCMALMVVFILAQVFWRYVLDNPLAWPEEAARFLMLWLMVVAPTALRRGGFVAIDMVQLMLPRVVAGVLVLVLLLLSLLVLVFAVRIGWSEVTGLAGKFKSSSLYYPSGDGWEKVPLKYMMAALLTGAVMLTSVTVELILRQVLTLVGHAGALPVIPHTDVVGAE